MGKPQCTSGSSVCICCVHLCVYVTTFQLNYKGPYDSGHTAFPEFTASPIPLIKHDPGIPRWEYQAQNGK